MKEIEIKGKVKELSSNKPISEPKQNAVVSTAPDELVRQIREQLTAREYIEFTDMVVLYNPRILNLR